MKVAHAIARAMKAEGVDILFAYPVNPLIEAAAEEDIRTVIVRQERVGLHMADAYSRVIVRRSRSASSACSTAPARRTRSAASRRRSRESVPILVIPAGYPRRLAHYYPNFNSTLNMQHVTKWAEPLTSGRAIPDVLRRPSSSCATGGPGPCCSRCRSTCSDEDVPDTWAVRAELHRAAAGPTRPPSPRPPGFWRAPQHPVIYAGQGVHYARAWDALKALAEAWNIPVTTSIEGKSAFPENHPLSLGSGGRANPRAVKTFLGRSRRHPGHRLQLRADRLRRARCRPARRSSTRRSIRWISTRTCRRSTA